MPVTRFAPSPTGYLHQGHAYSALFADRAAGSCGRLLLRIEDIDAGRCRPEYITAIEEDLAWLGLDWPKPVRVQSQHFAAYGAALERLSAEGLLYPCFCSRKEIRAEIARIGDAPHGIAGVLYPGTCRGRDASARADLIAAGMPYALRLDMGAAMTRVGRLTWYDRGRGVQLADPSGFGDVVLARKETPASYHLAATLDDHIQGVELVTRGEDLLPATHLHRLLQALLDLNLPDYHHHRLLTDARGKRYAKRDRAVALRDLRAGGERAQSLRDRLGFG